MVTRSNNLLNLELNLACPMSVTSNPISVLMRHLYNQLAIALAPFYMVDTDTANAAEMHHRVSLATVTVMLVTMELNKVGYEDGFTLQVMRELTRSSLIRGSPGHLRQSQ